MISQHTSTPRYLALLLIHGREVGVPPHGSLGYHQSIGTAVTALERRAKRWGVNGVKGLVRELDSGTEVAQITL